MAEKTGAASFLKSGFLSQYAEQWTSENRENNKEVFNRCENLNCIAQGIIYKKDKISREFQHLEFYLFSILFVRAASNFQAAIILLCRGMILEADILARSCLESTFMLGAARVMGPEFVTRLTKAHNEARKNMATIFCHYKIKKKT